MCVHMCVLLFWIVAICSIYVVVFLLLLLIFVARRLLLLVVCSSIFGVCWVMLVVVLLLVVCFEADSPMLIHDDVSSEMYPDPRVSQFDA